MDDMARPRNSPADSASHRLLLLLSLSLSPASKVIAKAGRRLEDGAFRCRTCGRSFPTFQALGGHRTSHKRPRVRAAGLDLLLGARPGKGGAAAADVVHRCNACGMVFATGQALGGHMRRHRTAFEVVAALEETMPTTTVSAGMSEDGGDDEHDDASRLSSSLIQFI